MVDTFQRRGTIPGFQAVGCGRLDALQVDDRSQTAVELDYKRQSLNIEGRSLGNVPTAVAPKWLPLARLGAR